MNKYSQRLLEEWKQHGKIIIAVDYDDTISPWRLHKEDDIYQTGIVDKLRVAKETGAYIVAFTACNEDRYPEIKQRFESLKIELDSINQNPINLPYGNQTKIYANIFLDDRAGLDQALSDLSDAMYEYRAYKASQAAFNNQF
jgi:hypothetical protein